MPSIALSIGVVIFGLGAILGLLSAFQTLQKSRSWSNYRQRRRLVGQARGALVLAILSAAVAASLLVLGRPGLPSPFPMSLSPGLILGRVLRTRTPIPHTSPTAAPTATQSSPTPLVVTASPSFPVTAEPTSTPSMPIAVEAMIQGTETPSYDVEMGRLRFSTTISGYELIAPGEAFANPIKQMYAVFTYQPADQQLVWTALWYQDSELKYVDTSSWSNSPPGIGVANWARDPVAWLAGDYEVQIFVGAVWKASGRFSLSGEPPTFTPTASATGTPKASATPFPSATPSGTPLPTASPVSSPTATQTPPPVAVKVFFTNTQLSGEHTPPFDEAVTREVSGSGSPINGALAEYFSGPTADEEARGLTGVFNGFTGYRRAELADGILSVYLEGNCGSNGTAYNIAQPLIATLKQFSGVLYVKIYDEYDHTRDALGNADSWPTCLDVVFTSTSTPRPTTTSTATASLVPTDQAPPTHTETPTSTSTPLPSPTRTPTASPTSSPTASATNTPRPTAAPTAVPATPSTPAPSIIDSIFTFFRQLFGGQ